MGITAILVTFNRVKYLQESIPALLNQSVELDSIIVVNNNSTDDTLKYLDTLSKNSKIKILNLKKNVGGAGGFNAGLKMAYLTTDSSDFWLLDDDTIADQDAALEFINAGNLLKHNYGFLSSNVRWIDGTSAVMNRPMPASDWNEPTDLGLIKLKYATFVSALINRSAVSKLGLPISDFFIWSDDTEFTLRISQTFDSYFVPLSKVTHKIVMNSGVDIVTDDSDRIGRYFYSIRNRLYIAKNYGSSRETFKGILSPIFTFFMVLFKSKNKRKKLLVILKGFNQGLFFNPKIEKVEEEK
ncbi:glycosyltransferase family 2 protein [Dellaglioa sp. P0083]|uniref:glycosyltransferase family 2 protein n=1 Tax=Dellaglioa kimchii TaxID=3344667 RepID=UPI0038D36861